MKKKGMPRKCSDVLARTACPPDCRGRESSSSGDLFQVMENQGDSRELGKEVGEWKEEQSWKFLHGNSDFGSKCSKGKGPDLNPWLSKGGGSNEYYAMGP